jgi:hypothetical protein
MEYSGVCWRTLDVYPTLPNLGGLKRSAYTAENSFPDASVFDVQNKIFGEKYLSLRLVYADWYEGRGPLRLRMTSKSLRHASSSFDFDTTRHGTNAECLRHQSCLYQDTEVRVLVIPYNTVALV